MTTEELALLRIIRQVQETQKPKDTLALAAAVESVLEKKREVK